MLSGSWRRMRTAVVPWIGVMSTNGSARVWIYVQLIYMGQTSRELPSRGQTFKKLISEGQTFRKLTSKRQTSRKSILQEQICKKLISNRKTSSTLQIQLLSG